MNKLQGSEGIIPFHQASMKKWTGYLRTGLCGSIEGTQPIQGIEQGGTQGICDGLHLRFEAFNIRYIGERFQPP